MNLLFKEKFTLSLRVDLRLLFKGNQMDLAKIIAVLVFCVGCLAVCFMCIGGAFYELSDMTAGYLKDVAIMCFVLCVAGKPLNLSATGVKNILEKIKS